MFDDEPQPCPVCQGFGCRTAPTHLAFEEWRDDVDRLNSRSRANGPVYVRERVIDTARHPNSKRETTFIRYSPGDYISIEEATRLGVPLLDADGNPVAAPQSPKPTPETQDVKPPKRTRKRKTETK